MAVAAAGSLLECIGASVKLICHQGMPFLQQNLWKEISIPSLEVVSTGLSLRLLHQTIHDTAERLE